MKKTILALACATMATGAYAQQYQMVITKADNTVIKVNVDDVTDVTFIELAEGDILPLFTDPILRDKIAAFDTNGDGAVTADEAEAITALDLSGTDVESLDGIQNLTALKTLNISSCKSLTSANLSANTALEFLQAGFASNLETLTLGEKPALTEMYLQYSGVNAIDLSGCPELQRVSIASTKIASADFTPCTKLVKLTAGGETLETLDFSTCLQLNDLSVDNTNAVKNVDFSVFKNMETLSLTKCGFSTFVTTGMSQLKKLTLDNNSSLYKIDVSKSMKLNYLSAMSCYSLEMVYMTEGQEIADLWGISNWMIIRVAREWPEDIAEEITDATFLAYILSVADTDGDGKITPDEAKAVEAIAAPNMGLTSVDLTWFPNITSLDLSGNALTAIDLSGNTDLTTLNLNGNAIASLNIEKQKSLQYFYAAGCGISDLKMPSSYGFIEVDLSNNALTTFSFTYQSKLVALNLANNQLTSCTLSSDSAIADLDLSNNQLTEMTMWSLKGLVNVKLNDNPFIQLNEVNRWTKLETIDCSNTNIPTLDLSKTEVLVSAKATDCPNLTTVYIGSNTTATITVSEGTQVVEGAPEQ